MTVRRIYGQYVLLTESNRLTALKTLTLRLRGSKTELEEMGEDVSDMATTTSQLQAKLLALTGGQVDIMLDANTFKNSTQILREMAEAWEDMTDIQRASALELMGGKRQANVLSALIQNFDTVEDVIETSANSAGSALKENERYLDSIQGKIDQFNNAMQAMWSNTLDSDVVKFFVSLGTELVKIVDKFGLIQTLLFSFLTFKSVFGKGSFDLASMLGIHELDKGWVFGEQGATGWFAKKFINEKKETEEIEKTIDDITDAAQNKMQTNIKEMPDGQLSFDFDATDSVQAETQEYKSLLSVLSQVQNVKLSMGDEQKVALQIDEINAAASQGQVALTQYASTLGDGDMALKAYIASLDGGQASLAGFNQFIQTHNAKVKTSGITAKAAAVGHALLNAAISMGISLIVSAAISAITALINKHKELARAAKEAMSEYSNATSTLREHHNTIEDIKDDYKELADGVDDLGNNVSLTTEEYERYNKIANQIAEIFPDMVSGYTAEGNAIIALKGNVDALTAAYEKEAQAARDALLVSSNDIFDNFKNNTTKDGFLTGKSNVDKLSFFEKFVNDQATIDDVTAWRKTMGTVPFDTILEDAGIDSTNWFSSDQSFYDALESNKAQVQAYYRTLKAEIEAEVASIKPLVHAYLEQDSSYSGLPTETKNIIAKTIDGFTTEFYSQFDNATQMNAWMMTNLVQPLQNADTSTEFQTAFDLQTSFNKGEVPVSDYLSQLASFQEMLSTLGVNEEIIKSVSLLFNTEGLSAKQNVAKEFLLDEFDANVGQLTKTDLDIVDKYAKEFEKDMAGVGYTWDAFIAKINEKKLIDAFSPQDFEKVSNGLDAIQSAYTSLSDAVEQYNSAGYLTLDSLQSILSLEPEYLALLQMENGQLSINQAAAEAMIQTKLAEAEANAIQSAMTQLETLAKEAATKATNDNATAATNAITSLGNYSSALGTVAQDAIVAAGAVSALNNAVDGAKEAGVSEEDINAVMSNLDTYLSLINTTRQNLSTSFVPIVTGGTGGNPEKGQKDTEIEDGWEALINKYENKLALITNERDRVQAEIDKAEARGGQASKEMYDDLIRLELEEKQLLKEKKAELEEYLRVHGDSIDPETWTDYNNEINSTAVAIEECTSNIYDFAQSLREIDMHYFEQATDEISRLAEEIDFVMSLFEDEDMYDDAGNLTEAGVTKINLLRDQMTAYAGLSKMWGDRLTELQNMQKGANGLYAFDEKTKNAIADDFQSMLDSGKIDKTTYDEYMQQLNDAWSAGGFSEEIYNEWVNEAEDGMRDAISAQKDVRDEMLDMYDEYLDKIEEGIEKEIEAYEDLIDVKKEELEAERDLYDFRKNIKNQSKDIASLERRIASLSGSSAASDIAEKRRLEAELIEKKEGLNDTYYDHAHGARSSALDDEVAAFTEAKNRYVEMMRETRNDTEWVINEMITNGIFNADVANDFLLRIQDTYNIPLSKELTEPWAAAADRAIEFKNKVGIIAGTDIPPYVTMISDDIRNKLATEDENNPWNQAVAMAAKYADFLTDNEFSLDNKDMTTFEGQINSIINKWNNVKKAADEAYSAQTRTTTVGGNENAGKVPEVTDYYNDNSSTQETPKKQEPPKKEPTPTRPASPTRPTFKKVGDFWSGVGHTGVSIGKKSYNKALEIEGTDAIYYPYTNVNGYQGYIRKGEGYTVLSNGKMDIHSMKPIYQKYAKGTTGTDRDEWALTDEPKFGDELVLVPGKDGNLSFMRKGTGVVPADMTQKLFELAQIPTSDLMNKNLTAIVPNITKNDFKNEFNFDSIVHVDKVDSDTLPKLEKMVDKKIDDFSRALNYSLKKFSR